MNITRQEMRKMDKTLDAIERFGYLAYGLGVTKCPYSEGLDRPEYKAWWTGWHKAQKAAVQAHPEWQR